MIRITKSPAFPKALTTRGARYRRQLENLHDADPAACQVPNNTRLQSRDGIYNDPAVKAQLRTDQHHKCCYCESLFTATSYGDVEHFRPKGGYQETWGGPLRKPGYYWLAYEWSNLFFSCQLCNQEYKGNYFPVVAEAARATSHTQDVRQEQPLLLNPASDEPQHHLTFVGDAIKGLDVRGEASIQAYGLDRTNLIRSRLDHLQGLYYARMVGAFTFTTPLGPLEEEFLQELNLSVAQGQEVAEEAKRLWREAAFDSAEYAGMVRANFPHLPTV